jgi:predicted metal-dependent peptidase
MGHGSGMERVSQARTKLVARLPFFGHLALKLRPRLCKEGDFVDTAAVAPDGTLVVNEKFLDTLSDTELCFVIAHEVMHPAMLYFERMSTRIPKLWNVAHDFAINLLIKQMADANIKVLDSALQDDKYRDWSAEEIYDDILKDAVLVNICMSGDGDPKDGQGKGQPGQGKGKPGKGQGGGRNPLNDPLFGDARPDLSESEDGRKAAQGDKGAQNRINTDWKISIVAAAQKHEKQKGRGSLPAGLMRLIEEFTDPKVDWREKLAKWVGENGRRQDYTYARPSRRSESVNQYLPSLKKYGVADVTVFVDTSGSIGDSQLKEGLAEIQGVCDDLGIGVRALVIDADVHDDIKVEDAYELSQKLSGGGGSNFCPGFEKLQDEGYEGVVIAFTDGDIQVPCDKPECLKGVLWCIYEGCRTPTTAWGETIEIPRDEESPSKTRR